MAVLEISSMIELAPEVISKQTQKKSLLREIKLERVRDVIEEDVVNGYGFWKRILKKDAAIKDASLKKLTRFRVEVGGWVNLPPDIHSVVSLLLEYEDGNGRHNCILDQMDTRGATQILLAGSVDLQVQGKVRNVRLYCGGVADRSIWIDNMHLKTSELHAAYMQAAS